VSCHDDHLMSAQDVYSSEEKKDEESTNEEIDCDSREDVYAHEGEL